MECESMQGLEDKRDVETEEETCGSDKTFNRYVSKDRKRLKRAFYLLLLFTVRFSSAWIDTLFLHIPNKQEEEPCTESWWNQEEPVGQLSCGPSFMFSCTAV